MILCGRTCLSFARSYCAFSFRVEIQLLTSVECLRRVSHTVPDSYPRSIP